MNETEISYKLDDYAAATVPDSVNVWPRIAAKLGSAPSPRAHDGLSIEAVRNQTHWQPRIPTFSLSLAGISTVLLIVAAVALIALRPTSGPSPSAVGNPLQHDDPATKTPTLTVPPYAPAPYSAQLEQAGISHVERLGTRLDITRSIGAYTVTIRHAYADANHIAVIYSIQGPPGQRFAPTNNTLKSQGGTTFRHIFGCACASETDTYAVVYDSTALANLPSHLDLSLFFDLVEIGQNGVEPPLFDALSANAFISSFQNGYVASPDAAQARQWNKVAGPVSIEFSVSVSTSGQLQINPGQTVVAEGVPMTLERVIVTPGETRAISRHTPIAPEQEGTPWTPVFDLQAADFSSSSASGTHIQMALRDIGNDTWSYSIFTDLADKSGAWSLTVSWQWLEPYPTGSHSTNERSTAPWTFTFEMPSTNK